MLLVWHNMTPHTYCSYIRLWKSFFIIVLCKNNNNMFYDVDIRISTSMNLKCTYINRLLHKASTIKHIVVSSGFQTEGTQFQVLTFAHQTNQCFLCLKWLTQMTNMTTLKNNLAMKITVSLSLSFSLWVCLSKFISNTVLHRTTQGAWDTAVRQHRYVSRLYCWDETRKGQRSELHSDMVNDL